MYDVIVVGAGPAGLSAALILGRCLRRVLVCDAGEARNASAHALHGYLTRDGTPPLELRRLGREDLRPYETVELRTLGVTRIEPGNRQFSVTLADGTREQARKLLLATGVVDDWPDLPGAEPMFGKSIHHCPYCDGWEWRHQPLAVYGRGEEGAGLALELTAWSRDLVLCTDGPASLAEHDRARLTAHNIPVREERIIGVEGDGGYLERILFAEGAPLARKAIFFSTPQHQRSIFPVQLGCEFTGDGAVKTDSHEATCVPGIYVAGDASRRAQFAIVAAGEGALAAEAINTALLKEDLAAEEGHQVATAST